MKRGRKNKAKEHKEGKSSSHNRILPLIVFVLLLLISGMLTKALSDWFSINEAKNTSSKHGTVGDGLLMTPDELRSFNGFEDLNDQLAREFISSMQQFCTLTLDVYNHENNIGTF